MGRLEQAGFLLPNGTFIRAVTPDANGCGAGDFGFPGPGPIPEGTILVHTHPATRNEELPACGDGLYRNQPSDEDITDLYQSEAISFGLIIDADGFIVFTKDQAEHKDGEAGKCGFQRIEN